jgi:hypothetical protein
MATQEILKDIDAIKKYFAANETPLFFISATNFNLLGMDEWVSHFYYITHIDSFDGKHPNLFSPITEVPHEEFQSIEDINNYLLEHPEVISFIRSKTKPGKRGKALFLMFNEKTEELAAQLNLDICFPKASLRNFLDNKVNTNRIAEKAGVACVPYILAPVKSYKELCTIAAHLGNDLVVQTPFGDSGHTTFFISNEADFDAHQDEIINESELKIMKRINCYGTAIEACVTHSGTLVTPLMTELIGFKELTPYQGGWSGNEIYPDAFNEAIRTKAQNYTQLFGNQLFKEGYKGYFELDFLIDKDNGEIYLGELNPRISGVSSLTNHAKFAMEDAPLFLFHLLEWMNIPYEINVSALNSKWLNQANLDSWSQLVIKHTRPTLEIAIKAPQTGIWEMKKNGKVQFEKMDANRQSIIDDNKAFYFQITQKDGYLYEGADLGILVMRGRQMSDEFILSERAKRWIRAIRSEYKSHIINPGILDENDYVEGDGFKFM